MLWHVVDISEPDDAILLHNIKSIENELTQYDPELLEKPRWLVFNKIDVLSEECVAERVAHVVEKLEWKEPVFAVSAIEKEGTQSLCQSMMSYLLSTINNH